jgi:hypothetical protein
MRRAIVLIAAIAAAVAVGPLVAQKETLLSLSQLRALGNGQLLAVLNNRIEIIGLEGLTIQNGRLKPLVAASAPQRRRLTFRPAGKVAEYVLPGPADQVTVYRNGLLMTEPDDYVLDGAIVRFASAQIPDVGDVVNVLYEVRQ